MTITKICNVGINDGKVSLFEGQYKVSGMAYNSYLIKDEKTAVFDTVCFEYGATWIDNIRSADAEPDFLIITHMEPDHSASIALFMKEFPRAKIVANAKAFNMIKNFFGEDFADRKTEVKDGDIFSLGETELLFVAAPMVHWPEVQMIYDKTHKILFSADAFGRFGTRETSDDRQAETRRYYIGIVGKYGMQVQAVLKKIATLDVSAIYPLHGEIITENLGYYIGLYDKWSSYTPEEQGTAIIYTSVYGNTEKAVRLLADEIKDLTGVTPPLYNLSECDIYEAVAAAFRYSNVVLATTTYNMDIFPYMSDFIGRLAERNFSNRKVALIENGSWAPNAVKVMSAMLEKCKNLTFCENKVKIVSALTEENAFTIKNLAKELTK
ncbi:MAG: FprA family A-type flavoprotein [Clostridia bacterium]|nr:FprA family A-type flavoprotein [Clostridia bacterium]